MGIPPGFRVRVYIASFFDTKDRLRPVVEALDSSGHYLVVSRWLQEVEGVSDEKAAARDLEDLNRANLVIVDTFDITPRGGREVELGVALATGKPVILVGPTRNVFHSIVKTRFDSWEKALVFLGAVEASLVELS